jgi:uncharacterized membrane protein
MLVGKSVAFTLTLGVTMLVGKSVAFTLTLGVTMLVGKSAAFTLTLTHSLGVTILVGKSAADNDVVSLDRSIRDQDDWWLHAAGSAGSHVVIRSLRGWGTGCPFFRT